MKINFSFDITYIIYNKYFLSFIGSLMSIFILYIYKCVTICKHTNKWSFIKLFILNYIINFLILYIYSLHNINNNIELNHSDTESLTF